MLFYFCTTERAQATTKVLSSLGSTINNIRGGKSNDSSQVIIVPSQGQPSKTDISNSNDTAKITKNQVASMIDKAVAQSSNSTTESLGEEKKEVSNRVVF